MSKITRKRIDAWRIMFEHLHNADDEQLLRFINRIVLGPMALGFAYGIFVGVLVCGLVLLR